MGTCTKEMIENIVLLKETFPEIKFRFSTRNEHSASIFKLGLHKSPKDLLYIDHYWCMTFDEICDVIKDYTSKFTEKHTSFIFYVPYNPYTFALHMEKVFSKQFKTGNKLFLNQSLNGIVDRTSGIIFRLELNVVKNNYKFKEILDKFKDNDIRYAEGYRNAYLNISHPDNLKTINRLKLHGYTISSMYHVFLYTEDFLESMIPWLKYIVHNEIDI